MHNVCFHIFQDTPTPHNDALIREMRKRDGLQVYEWYMYRSLNSVPYKALESSTHKHALFLDSFKNWLLILFHFAVKREPFMVVGYANIMARILFIASYVLFIKFRYWTDHPQEPKGFISATLRRFGYYILKKRACALFVVGNHTRQYFIKNGFSESKVINLPIFIELPAISQLSESDKLLTRSKYNISTEQVWIVAGSRLIFDKGFDVLIHALSVVIPKSECQIKATIVGSGPEESALKAACALENISDCLTFLPWLPADEFSKVLLAGDIFVHPARIDAFGGGTLLAMAAGLPVIASDGVGAARERIVDGFNGLMFPSADASTLADRITQLVNDVSLRKHLGLRARQTAENWHPAKGVCIICHSLE